MKKVVGKKRPKKTCYVRRRLKKQKVQFLSEEEEEGENDEGKNSSDCSDGIVPV